LSLKLLNPSIFSNIYREIIGDGISIVSSEIFQDSKKLNGLEKKLNGLVNGLTTETKSLIACRR